jgi:hypothetical protein
LALLLPAVPFLGWSPSYLLFEFTWVRSDFLQHFLGGLDTRDAVQELALGENAQVLRTSYLVAVLQAGIWRLSFQPFYYFKTTE